MIATSFTLRSPCSWELQCEMYVLQFYLNLFSVVLAQLRLTLRIYIFTRSHPQIYFSTSPHPHICTSILHLYIHTVAPSHVSCLSFFLSTYLFSRLCAFTSSQAHIHRSTSPPPYIYTSILHLHIHTVTPSHPPSLSLFLYIFSTVLDNYMSRSRANRRLVVFCCARAHLHLSLGPSFRFAPPSTGAPVCVWVCNPWAHREPFGLEQARVALSPYHTQRSCGRGWEAGRDQPCVPAPLLRKKEEMVLDTLARRSFLLFSSSLLYRFAGGPPTLSRGPSTRTFWPLPTSSGP